MNSERGTGSRCIVTDERKYAAECFFNRFIKKDYGFGVSASTFAMVLVRVVVQAQPDDPS